LNGPSSSPGQMRKRSVRYLQFSLPVWKLASSKSDDQAHIPDSQFGWPT
jgi:hypothetical protein